MINRNSPANSGLVAAIALLACPALSYGQRQSDTDDSYVPIPLKVQGDKAAREFLDQKLGRARSVSELEKLAREVAGQWDDKNMSAADREALKKMAQDVDLNDPQTQELMKRLLDNPPSALRDKLSEEQRGEWKKLLEDMKPAQGGSDGDPGAGKGSSGSGSDRPPSSGERPNASSAATDRSKPDSVASGADAQSQQPAGKLGLGDSASKLAKKILSRSGALEHPSMFKKTFSKLSEVRSKGASKAAGAGNRWLPSVAKLIASDKDDPKKGPSTFFGRLKPPGVGGDSGGASGGSLDRDPSLGGSDSAIDAGGIGAVGSILVVVVAVGLIAAAVYYVSRLWQSSSATGRMRGWRPGPWPVDPATVGTRQQLIQAFEYLAVLLLGRQARSQNHRQIAGELQKKEGGDRAARTQAAQLLAGLYEQARYAPGDEPLSPEQLAKAQSDLMLLAGLANS